VTSVFLLDDGFKAEDKDPDVLQRYLSILLKEFTERLD
jgi:hypothetical protein